MLEQGACGPGLEAEGTPGWVEPQGGGLLRQRCGMQGRHRGPGVPSLGAGGVGAMALPVMRGCGRGLLPRAAWDEPPQRWVG